MELHVLTIDADYVAPMLEWLGACRVVTLKLCHVGERDNDNHSMHPSLLDGFDPALEHLEMLVEENSQRDHLRAITQSTYSLRMHGTVR